MLQSQVPCQDWTDCLTKGTDTYVDAEGLRCLSAPPLWKLGVRDDDVTKLVKSPESVLGGGSQIADLLTPHPYDRKTLLLPTFSVGAQARYPHRPIHQ